MSKLELDLMEYVHTRESEMEAAIKQVGIAGAMCGHGPRGTIADLRAIMDGQPLPARGAE